MLKNTGLQIHKNFPSLLTFLIQVTAPHQQFSISRIKLELDSSFKIVLIPDSLLSTHPNDIVQ